MLEQESVCNIDLDTEPRSKKTGTRRDRRITEQQKPVCCSRPAQLFTIKSATEAPGFIHGEEVAVSPFLLNF